MQINSTGGLSCTVCTGVRAALSWEPQRHMEGRDLSTNTIHPPSSTASPGTSQAGAAIRHHPTSSGVSPALGWGTGFGLGVPSSSPRCGSWKLLGSFIYPLLQLQSHLAFPIVPGETQPSAGGAGLGQELGSPGGAVATALGLSREPGRAVAVGCPCLAAASGLPLPMGRAGPSPSAGRGCGTGWKSPSYHF